MSVRIVPALVAVIVLTVTLGASSAVEISSPPRGGATTVPGNRQNGDEAFAAAMDAIRANDHARALPLLEEAARTSRLVRDYALLYLARSRAALREYRQAIAPLDQLVGEFPDSRLVRRALFERGDILASAGRHREAVEAYETAIKRYPSGKEALRASLRQALSRIESDDPTGAIQQLRTIWVTSPTSPEADEADETLRRLATSGIAVPPVPDEDRLRRATNLSQGGHHRKAVAELEKLLSRGDDRFRRRVLYRIGESYFKSRSYQKAHETFSALFHQTKDPAHLYWDARSLARMGKKEEAAVLFRRLVDDTPRSEHADDALYQLGLLTAEKGDRPAAVSLFRRLISDHPKSSLKPAARWEIGLLCLMEGKMEEAARELTPLVDDDRYRERSLFWLSVAAERRNLPPDSYLRRIGSEYPLGFYAAFLRHQGKLPPLETTPLDRPLDSLLPDATEMERERFLIRCGLTDDALAELRLREKSGLTPRRVKELARIYLQINRFDALPRLAKGNASLPGVPSLALALSYPPAYLETVREVSRNYSLSPALLLALIRAESSYDPKAVSPAGAVGLTQLLPATAQSMVKGVKRERLMEPELNLSLGARHLRDLLDRYGGDPLPALAAYNAGSTPVDRWIARGKGLDRLLFIETIPYRETREYVKKIIAATSVYLRLYPGMGSEETVTALLFGKRNAS